MKILHISDQPPGYNSGGQLGILQFSYAWTRVGHTVDYIGPQIENEEIKSWYNSVFFLNDKLSIADKIDSLLHLQFDRKYISWKHKSIDFQKYEVIYLDFTKMDYVVRDIRKYDYKGKLIVRAHNVEADFFRINYITNKNLINFLKYKAIKPREGYIVSSADCILAITREDKNRLAELYHIPKEKILICPVGVNLPREIRAVNDEPELPIRCLITGSLWFGPNVKATEWFIDTVYPAIKDKIKLTIAGYKPNEILKRKCKENNICLIDSPANMEPYFEDCSLFIAPIFEGGGMKVKIAEAMSYNLPIITTSHGAIGYEFKNGENGYIANTTDEFIAAFEKFTAKDKMEKNEMLRKINHLYVNHYSLESVRKYCQELLDNIL